MAAGKVHDRVTLALMPLVLLGGWAITRNPSLTLILGLTFGFSGWMFGPDLDIYSCQYQRWGWLRWIWIPYQKKVPHRSPLSHGFLLGTVGRLLYLGGSVGGTAVGARVIWDGFQGLAPWQTFTTLANFLIAWTHNYGIEAFVGFIGLELGAMSHSLWDWGGSWYQRRTRPHRRTSRGVSPSSKGKKQGKKRRSSR